MLQYTVVYIEKGHELKKKKKKAILTEISPWQKVMNTELAPVLQKCPLFARG